MNAAATEVEAPAVPHPTALTTWGEAEEWGELVVCGVRDVTHDVKTFVLEPLAPELFHFDPGQFITLSVHAGGERLERCYSIASPPTRPHRLAITVKRTPGGRVSTWLHENVVVGSRLMAAAPLGSFTMVRHPATRYLFLSAGSGITPVMSMTRTLVDLAADVDVVFVHSARTPADIIFRPELWGMSTQSPSVRVVQVCSAGTADQEWYGYRGRVDRALLQEVVPDLHDREVFVCGPDGYMAAVREALVGLGFDMAHHHEETYTFEALPPTAFAVPGEDGIGDFDPGEAETPDGSCTVTMARSGRTFGCAPDETVLDAAFRAGISPPSSCSQGMCGTCKTVLLSGEVDMHHNGGIRPREVAAGKVLICCSTPLGDVVLDA